jgi:hypothetical protein
MAISLRDQIIQEIDHLNLEQQQMLLRVAQQFRNARLPGGTPGGILLQRAAEINFPHEDLMEMMQAIEKDTETIDEDGW